MTTPDVRPFNTAGDNAHVGVQAQNAYFETITLPGDVKLTAGQDASPENKYKAGVENLKSGKAGAARQLIWDAMMDDDYYVSSNVLFHWLVAMLSGRTVREFSKEEIDQLKRFRSRWAEARGDPWADGVRLIYRLLDSALPSFAAEAEPKAAKTDMPLLVKEFDGLGEEQRDLILPHLELFLTGQLKDEMWQRELEFAQSRQHANDRLGRAWMFFQPVPANVFIPPPRLEWVTTADRLAMRASAGLFAAATGYLCWELLWHGAILGLLGYVAGLAGGVVAGAASLELRFLTERRRLKDERFRAPDPSAPLPSGDELADRVDKLFNRYFAKYEPDKAERERWKTAAAGIRQFHRNEIIGICRSSEIPADRVAWLIRYEVCQLNQHWQKGTLRDYRRQFPPRPGLVATSTLHVLEGVAAEGRNWFRGREWAGA
jgi:hypothetical protein